MSACRDCANNNTETITFRCEAVRAGAVSLIGDFNGWDPAVHPMRREAGGSWSLQLPLAAGKYHYQFLIDGKPVLDPHAMYKKLKDHGQDVSFLAVD
jgi:1,4-alpha-glucan branching enzyme